MKQKEMSQLTIVIDKSLREQAKLVFKASGLSLQEAITYFFEQCTERNTLPFAVCRDPQTRGSKAPELAVRVFDIDTKTWPFASEMCNLSVRIDEELREHAEKVFADWGLSVSSAVTMFVKQSVFDSCICC